ncbi:DeoR/GlpR family DNA-binding transcription regulator [Streptococcus australis]|uniref:DeoR/GlpR family DNA-binding transcription regulator n=1 Tax=Streptococcus australis TaxID=113107 RepID=UPI0039C10C17
MKKQERLNEIINLVNKAGTVYVQDIMESMQVSDMTVRRDLIELEKQGLLIRVRNGAKSNQFLPSRELPHEEKLLKNILAKREVAKKASELIKEGESIFLGPGTSVEVLSEAINNKELRVVTNCLPIFQELLKKKSDTFKVILLGGELRETSQAFVGEITNTLMERMYFHKMFFSGNGIVDGRVLTSSFEEAYTQKLALERSSEAYLLIDSSKIGKEDFTSICSLKKVTAVITDDATEKAHEELEEYTRVIV